MRLLQRVHSGTQARRSGVPDPLRSLAQTLVSRMEGREPTRPQQADGPRGVRDGIGTDTVAQHRHQLSGKGGISPGELEHSPELASESQDES